MNVDGDHEGAVDVDAHGDVDKPSSLLCSRGVGNTRMSNTHICLTYVLGSSSWTTNPFAHAQVVTSSGSTQGDACAEEKVLLSSIHQSQSPRVGYFCRSALSPGYVAHQ